MELIDKFRIRDDEEFRDFYVSSDFSTKDEYRRLRPAGHVVSKLMLEIPEACKQAVRRRGCRKLVQWRAFLLFSLNVRDLPGQVVTLLLTNTFRSVKKRRIWCKC